jgi:catechol 2,3-dioxygenase-like lactoylglutathione lyase family enzyme
MLKRLSHTGVWVKDQNEALRFYTEKLGFEIRSDITMGDYRWLTVGLKEQPDLEIVLNALSASGPMGDNEEALRMVAALQDSGQMSGGVLTTDDCWKTYEELSAKGVEFIQPATERPYGIEAVFKDNSGNWFSLAQHFENPAA